LAALSNINKLLINKIFNMEKKLSWISPDFKVYDKSVTASGDFEAPAESDATTS
jgi:hypothetical protein